MARLIIHSKTHGRKTIIYDDEDRSLISKYNWIIQRKEHLFYAVTVSNKKSLNRKMLMHRLIMGFPNCIIDHKDLNGLNNKRNNLRKCNQSLNMANGKIRSDNSTGFKGVYYLPKYNRYRVFCRKKNQKRIEGGYFSNKIDAAKRYNELATHLFGEFARLNKIPK